MTDDAAQNLKQIVHTLAENWKLSLITAGMNAGLFQDLNPTTPVSIGRLADKYRYDPEKLDKWFYYCVNAGLVKKEDGGYVLTPFSMQFMPDSPYKDIVGFVRINDFFMRAAIESAQLFRPNSSLDKLTEGKITRDYQPKVSDNLSASVISLFKKYNMGGEQTLLDIGCGNAAFLRTLANNFPGLKMAGLDSNLFAIEWGKKLNQQHELGERIKMIVGDATSDMADFENESYDWVIAINLFHFFPVKSRYPLIENMIRIAKKGVFFTEVMVETTPISAAADPLMSLLWNDFTGFFRVEEAEEINNRLSRQFLDCIVEKHQILQGSSYLVSVIKKI